MQIEIQDLSTAFAKVSDLFKSNSSLKSIAPLLLQEFGRPLNCQWGTYWIVSTEAHQLKPFATWIAEGFSAPELNRDTENRTLSISEGTAGHVWRSKKPVWTLDLAQDMCLPRSLDAEKSGLTGGLWFALKTDDTVYAVIELLGQYIVPPRKELIIEIENIGIRLGNLLQERAAR
jgi:hypothetical protein